MNANCTGLLGRLLGHRFTPAYNYTPPTLRRIRRGADDDSPMQEVTALIEKCSRREVAYIFCTRCGATIEHGNA